MSIIQSIIGSAVGVAAPAPSYPAPGDAYPVFIGGVNAVGVADTPSGYYEESSLVNPTLGLFRRTYNTTTLDGSFTIDTTFPQAYTPVEQLPDAAVGFGNGYDVAQNFSMEWTGYFKPNTTANYIFSVEADDYAVMWLGANAINPDGNTPNIITANNARGISMLQSMTAGKYYPVRLRYTEVSGAHQCIVGIQVQGGSSMNTNQNSTDGQFFYDNNIGQGVFPSGLIT
jgi:hypothetical protein